MSLGSNQPGRGGPFERLQAVCSAEIPEDHPWSRFSFENCSEIRQYGELIYAQWSATDIEALARV